jgi:hypothetical protein
MISKSLPGTRHYWIDTLGVAAQLTLLGMIRFVTLGIRFGNNAGGNSCHTLDIDQVYTEITVCTRMFGNDTLGINENNNLMKGKCSSGCARIDFIHGNSSGRNRFKAHDIFHSGGGARHGMVSTVIQNTCSGWTIFPPSKDRNRARFEILNTVHLGG